MASTPPNQIPHGYTLLRSPSSLLEFFEPNLNKETELDFNHYMYMTLRPGGGIDDYEEVPADLLQAIVRTPELPWEEKLKDMIMIGDDGYFGPAFLPHFGDVLGNLKLENIFRRLEKGNNEYDGVSKVVPKVLKKLVDPKPKLKFKGPMYPLSLSPVDICMGHYTDALVIFKLARPLSEINMVVTRGFDKKDHIGFVRFVGLRITPTAEEGPHQLAGGWSLVVWNVRHVGRPSMKENFARIVQIHNPYACYS